MTAEIEINSKKYRVDLQNPHDISIHLDFTGDQPNSYGIPKSTATPFSGNGWSGDVRQGGSCNFDEIKTVPHCNGTHTECVGHISRERIAITEILRDCFVPATLITIQPVKAQDCGENYDPPFEVEDMIIIQKELEKRLKDTDSNFRKALVIRTLPNDSSKKTRQYTEIPAPFFTSEAMEFIASIGIEHLLVDFPSLDRARDEGKLTAHHIFWNVPQGSHDVSMESASSKTVTEFIFVPNEIPDGKYMLNLQIAPWKIDASPSRPMLFPIIEENRL